MAKQEEESFGSAIGGVALGIILFFASIPVLWWNEGRTIQRTRILDEGEKLVVSVNSASIESGNNGKLVHLSGHADTSSVVKDPLFGIEVQALKLKRVVEMYQWIETRQEESAEKENKNVDSQKKWVYSYATDWSTTLHNSADFYQSKGHENPTSFPFDGVEYVATPIHVGAFILSPHLMQEMTNYEAFLLSEQTYKLMSSNMQNTLFLRGNFYVSSKGESSNNGNSSEQEFQERGLKVGDVRVHFEVIYPQEVSVLGKQYGDRITSFTLKRDKIEYLVPGFYTADEMFEMLHEENRWQKWGYRLLGFLLAFFGLSAILRPFSYLGEQIPFLGRTVGGIFNLVSVIFALIISCVTISLGWIFYRPFISIPILAASVCCGGYLILQLRQRRKIGEG